MTCNIHLVGSISLDTVTEVFNTVGEVAGPYLKRCPDGETGGRRLWVSWQYPFLRSNPALEVDPDTALEAGTGFARLRVKDGNTPESIHFGELGYAHEARASYALFRDARERGALPPGIRFQVCLPTPFAVLAASLSPAAMPLVEPAYEQAMMREIQAICAAIPHADLALQWDVCVEMVAWDGRSPVAPAFPGMREAFAQRFHRLTQAVPEDVELGIHLCYGDLDGVHFIQPIDTGKAVELANLIIDNSTHALNWIHLPVPMDRDDGAYFEPLTQLRRPQGCELYLGLVHATDGVAGARRRMQAARRCVQDFGIATECGMARAHTPELVRKFLAIHAQAAGD